MNYYETLGISQNATDNEIKKAFRKKAMEYHPDRNKGDKKAEEKFKEINEAYETLKDPQKKAAYDRYGHDAYKQAASGEGPSGFSQGFNFNFGGGSGTSFADIFEEIFNSTGGGDRTERMDMRGNDLRFDTSITLEDAFKGKDIEINIKTHVKCETCKGTGSEEGQQPKQCPSCRGTGRMRFSQGFFTVERTCNACNGTGHIIEKSCKDCRGSGRVMKSRTLTINIPAGIANGAKIRLSGEGESGIRNGRAGDLYVFVLIKPHSLFRRENNAIHCDVPVSFVQAALGGEIEVPTIDGTKAIVKIPTGTQSGQILKLRSKGMSILRSTLRGDMFVHAIVETPTKLTPRQRELLEEFDKEQTAQPKSEGFFAKVKDFLGQG